MKVYQAIAHCLKDSGVDLMFGLMGDGNLFMASHYIDECNGEYIAATHEANALLMALGYSQLSGRIGVATVTHGPALTNTITALVEGVKASVPAVLLAGDTPVDDKGHPQNVNQYALVTATGAGFEQLVSPDSVAFDLHRAFCRAKAECRPIVFNMPLEFQWRDCNYTSAPLYLPQPRFGASTGDDLDKAAGIIASSRWPVVIAGRGAISLTDRESLIRFADRIGAPLSTTLRGKGLFDGEPFNLGICGTLSTPVAFEVLQKSDCLIVFGATLTKFTAALGALTANKRIVQIAASPNDLGRYYPIDAGLIGSPGLVADTLVNLLDQADIPSTGARTSELAASLQAYKPASQMPSQPRPGTVDQLRALHAIDAAVPSDRIYVTDCGRFIIGAWTEIRVSSPRDFIHTMGFNSVGLGLSEAIGAAIADRSKPTLLMVGDGGFMLGGVNELHTAVQHQLDLIIVICNDGAYGAEHIQFRNRNMNPHHSQHSWPDFIAVADSFGAASCRVTSDHELLEMAEIIKLRDPKVPLVIDLRLDSDCMLIP